VVDRKIISRINIITEAIGKKSDYYMKKIFQVAPTRLKDSQMLIKEIGILPLHDKLFTADANVMYANIQLYVGIAAIAGWMKDYPYSTKGHPTADTPQTTECHHASQCLRLR
jgi:hypothetical protein